MERKEVETMPAIYAHFVFGEKMKKVYSPQLKEKALHSPELFEIGLHGPDILFYYHPLGKNRVNQTGYRMHEQPGGEFFRSAAEKLKSLPGDEQGDALSYLLGFLCHFSLDRSCHPYIENKIKVDGVTHNRIETDFDRYLLVEEGRTPLKRKTTGHLRPSRGNSAVIRKFFDGITTEEVEKALESMVRYNDLLTTPNPWLRALIQGGMRLAGSYRSLRGLLMDREEDPACRDSCARLEKLMNRAVKTGVLLTENYLDYLEGKNGLAEEFEDTFGPGENWEQIPVLSLEEELCYEI